MVVTVTFAMIVLWSIASAKAGKAGYDERESKVAARAHGFTLMLSFSYVMLIAMVVKEFDFGSLLPLAIYSIVPFQIIASRLIFEVLKHMPNAEGAAGG
jgi:hypothetical protein